MKYRRLTMEELAEVEQEFVRFLAANTITAEEWEQFKQEQPQRAEALIGEFSDIVFDKVLTGVRYLEFKTPRDIKTFQCGEDRIVLMGLQVNGESEVDFTRNQTPGEIMEMLRLSGARLQLYKAEKAYSRNRELELFEMMENGARISRDGGLFLALQQLKGKGEA